MACSCAPTTRTTRRSSLRSRAWQTTSPRTGLPEMREGPASTRSRWAAAAVAVAALAYAAASYALMTRAQDSAWSLAIVVGPLLVVSAAWAWNAGHRLLAVAGGVGAVVLAAVLLGLQGTGGHGIPSRWLYLAQHAGVHL